MDIAPNECRFSECHCKRFSSDNHSPTTLHTRSSPGWRALYIGHTLSRRTRMRTFALFLSRTCTSACTPLSLSLSPACVSLFRSLLLSRAPPRARLSPRLVSSRPVSPRLTPHLVVCPRAPPSTPLCRIYLFISTHEQSIDLPQ